MLGLPESGARQDTREPGSPARATSLPQHPSGSKGLAFVCTWPSCVCHSSLPFCRTRQGGLPPSFLLGASWLRAQRQPALGQGVVATRWGQGAQALCRQQEGGRLHPGALRFYELQREAKFPQPPNETESKSELIGNRQEGGELEEACTGVGTVSS